MLNYFFSVKTCIVVFYSGVSTVGRAAITRKSNCKGQPHPFLASHLTGYCAEKAVASSTFKSNAASFKFSSYFLNNWWEFCLFPFFLKRLEGSWTEQSLEAQGTQGRSFSCLLTERGTLSQSQAQHICCRAYFTLSAFFPVILFRSFTWETPLPLSSISWTAVDPPYQAGVTRLEISKSEHASASLCWVDKNNKLTQITTETPPQCHIWPKF